MAKNIEDEVEYYYDSHSTEEDLMGESFVHFQLMHYLFDVLHWLFRGQVCAICGNLNFYRTCDWREVPITPDIAVIKGIPPQMVTSWKIWKTGVVPHVVFEIASKETWDADLKDKPQKYAQIGVQEYYAYDPNEPRLWKDDSRRLRGWQLDRARREMIEMVADADGRLWSALLESWLVADGEYLRLYDRDNRRRLKGEEAEAEARRAEARRAEIEAGRAEAEAKRAQVFAEKLRSLGINPDEIS